MADPSATALDIMRRYERAESARGTFEGEWEKIARRVLPSYAGSFTSAGVLRNQGTPNTEEMVDATAALALPKFAAAMESMLTPRSQTWHRLQPVDKAMQRNRTVRMYFDDVNDLLFKYRYAPRANYASQQHEVYMGLGAFGTGSLYVDALAPRYGKGLRYRAIHLGEVYFLENHQGIIDTALRKFPLTARQAVQQFADSVPPQIKEAADSASQAENKFWFIHCVSPRAEEDGYDPRRLDAKGMQYASHYISLTGKTEVLQNGRESGYRTFPYPISRYVVAPGETYGRSPAMLALPSINVLNEQKRTVLKQGHRTVDPVLLTHDDGVIGGMNMRPGSVNPGGVTADGRPLVHALPVGNLSLAKEMMEFERNTINDAFLVTLFQILVETPQMTATEVLERSREKGALLSPTMGRQQSEALGPMIEREIDVLEAQGLLPPMPPIVRAMNGEYDTVYDSPLSRAQRAEKATGFMQWVNYARDIVAVTQDPSVLDYANWDEAMPELADISAVPTAWVNDPDTVASIRQGRAKAQQTQQLVDSAPALSSVAKALPQLRLNGQAPAGGGA